MIEAVFESLAVKCELLARLNALCAPHAIFASNTSTLSITEIAAGSGREDRFVGMHFCLPAPLMKLVEMSPGLKTSDEAFAAAWRFCEAMGQRPVKTQDRPGFILNAFVVPFNNDAIRLVEAGVAAPADIDRAVKRGLGYPMGPLELLDLIGLDTQLLLCEALYGVTHEPRAACPPLVKRMIAAGQLGRKTGQGFYRYDRDAMFRRVRRAMHDRHRSRRQPLVPRHPARAPRPGDARQRAMALLIGADAGAALPRAASPSRRRISARS